MPVTITKAWETTDGKLFRHVDLDLAMKHQKFIDNEKKEERLLRENKESIIKRFYRKHKIVVKNVTLLSDWDCEDKKNPVGRCLQGQFKKKRYNELEPCCLYCGEPEERK